MGFRYSIENAFRMLEEAQGMQIKVKLATTNPNFTLEDNNRVSFFNNKIHNAKVKADATWTEQKTIDLLKSAWTTKHFAEDFTGAKFIESGVLSGSMVMVKDPNKSYEEYRNVSYVYTENDGVKKYYFVTSMSFPNRDLVEYSLYLDSITTYLDSNSLGGFTKIDRKHYDRYNQIPLTDAARTIIDTVEHIAMPGTVSGNAWTHYIDFTNLIADGFGINDADDISFSKGEHETVDSFAQVGDSTFLPWSTLHITNGKFDNGQITKTTNVGLYTTLTYTIETAPDNSVNRIKIDITWTGNNPRPVFFGGIIKSHIKTTFTAYTEPNFDRSSGVWNKDDQMPIESLMFKESLTASKSTSDTNYADYIKYFNVGSDINPKYVYMLKKVDTANKNLYAPDNSLVDGGGGLISFLVPLHNKVSSFTIGGHTWTEKTSINDIDTLSTVNVNSFIVLDEPLYVHPAGMKDLGDGLWAVPTNDSFHKDLTKLKIHNPLRISLDMSAIKLDTPYDYEKEIKLKSEEYMRLNLYAATGESKDLANYFIDTHKPLLEIEKSSIISETKTYGVYDLNAVYKQRLNDNQRILYTSHFEQLPSLSDPYKEYMNSHMSSYQSGLIANKENLGLNMAKSVLGASWSGITASALSYSQKARQYRAQVKDLKRQGDEPIGSSTSLFRDNINQVLLNINNGVMLNVYEPIEVQRKAIAAHFNKFGYVSNELLQFSSYSDFSTRYIFSFWDTAEFASVIDKTKLSTEIANDIASQFNSGITLWNVMNESGDTKVNDYTKENWENWIADIAN